MQRLRSFVVWFELENVLSFHRSLNRQLRSICRYCAALLTRTWIVEKSQPPCMFQRLRLWDSIRVEQSSKSTPRWDSLQTGRSTDNKKWGRFSYDFWQGIEWKVTHIRKDFLLWGEIREWHVIYEQILSHIYLGILHLIPSECHYFLTVACRVWLSTGTVCAHVENISRIYCTYPLHIFSICSKQHLN